MSAPGEGVGPWVKRSFPGRAVWPGVHNMRMSGVGVNLAALAEIRPDCDICRKIEQRASRADAYLKKTRRAESDRDTEKEQHLCLCWSLSLPLLKLTLWFSRHYLEPRSLAGEVSTWMAMASGCLA